MITTFVRLVSLVGKKVLRGWQSASWQTSNRHVRVRRQRQLVVKTPGVYFIYAQV